MVPAVMAGMQAALGGSSFLSSLGTAGGVLQGIGGVVDGIKGLFGGKSNGAAKEARHIQWDNYVTAKDLAYNGIQRRVEDAKKAGVHPVYALGGSTAQFTPSTAAFVGNDGSVGDSMRQMGAGLQRAAAVGQTPQERLANRLIESQIEGQELDNAKKASDLRLQQTGATVPLGINDAFKHRLASLDTPLGSNHGTLPQHQIIYDEAGKPVQILNPDLEVDSELLSAAHAMMYTVPQWLWNNTGGRSLSRKLRGVFQRDRQNPYKQRLKQFNK